MTYYRDVLPILQSNCQQCHRPGEVGPFALMTYKQAVNWASDIKEYTQIAKMPPWKPVEGRPFHNERKLTDKEIATLAAWVDGGTPEGDPKDAPPPRQFVDGWQLGKPDLVLTVSDDFQLGPGGQDLFRCFVLPTDLTEDKYVVAVEVQAGQPAHRPPHAQLLRHHRNAAASWRRRRRTETEEGRRAGPRPRLLAWRWAASASAADGGLRRLGAGQLPRPARGLRLLAAEGLRRGLAGALPPQRPGREGPHADRPLLRQEAGASALQGPGDRPAVEHSGGSSAHPGGRGETTRSAGHVWVGRGLRRCTRHAAHAHARQEDQGDDDAAGAAAATLVAIKDWDYNWQETYFLKEPIKVKAGTRFDVEAVYDNSDKNPNNPFNPPQIGPVRRADDQRDVLRLPRRHLRHARAHPAVCFQAAEQEGRGQAGRGEEVTARTGRHSPRDGGEP